LKVRVLRESSSFSLLEELNQSLILGFFKKGNKAKQEFNDTDIMANVTQKVEEFELEHFKN